MKLKCYDTLQIALDGKVWIDFATLRDDSDFAYARTLVSTPLEWKRVGGEASDATRFRVLRNGVEVNAPGYYDTDDRVQTNAWTRGDRHGTILYVSAIKDDGTVWYDVKLDKSGQCVVFEESDLSESDTSAPENPPNSSRWIPLHESPNVGLREVNPWDVPGYLIHEAMADENA